MRERAGVDAWPVLMHGLGARTEERARGCPRLLAKAARVWSRILWGQVPSMSSVAGVAGVVVKHAAKRRPGPASA
eukprot:3734664-Rhodomonas_salina.1